MSWKIYDGQTKAHAEIVKNLIKFGLSNEEAQKEATQKMLRLRNKAPGVYDIDAGCTILRVRVT